MLKKTLSYQPATLKKAKMLSRKRSSWEVSDLLMSSKQSLETIQIQPWINKKLLSYNERLLLIFPIFELNINIHYSLQISLPIIILLKIT
jgi:hypothetical protein